MRFARAGLLMLGLPLLLAAADPPALRLPAPQLSPEPDAVQAPALRLPPSPAEIPPPLRAPPRAYGPQKLAFADGVSAQFDVPYQNLRGFRPLTLDLYQPAGGRDIPLPLVVFIHGGGWNGGDTRHAGSFEDFPAQLAALAAQGYVVASVSYRLSGEAHFPAPVQDIKSAIRWLRAHGGELGLDPTRVAVWGDAAGGQLAALTGVTCGVQPFEPQLDKGAPEPPSDCVQAVIDWYGITDLASLPSGEKANAPAKADDFAPPPSSDEGDFLGCEPARCSPVLTRLASPVTFISSTSPAFLIQHGATDTVVPPAQSQKLYDALHKAGVPVELAVYPEVGHNFARDGFPDPSTNKAAMDRIEAFLARTFPLDNLARKIALPDRRGPLY